MRPTAGPSTRTPGQELALEQLRRIQAESGGALALEQVDSEPNSLGWLKVDLSLDCSDIQWTPAGLKLKSREPFTLLIPDEFPFQHPHVRVPHGRFAGLPHVQWGHSIYLYQPDDWAPSDGMYGFLERLATWYERVALGTLDPQGGPLHPPVASAEREAGCVVVRADAPRASSNTPWLGAAILHQVGPERVDVHGWIDIDDVAVGDDRAGRVLLDRLRSVAGRTDRLVFLAIAVVLPESLAFEPPATVSALIDAFTVQDVSRDRLVDLIGTVARTNEFLAGEQHLKNRERSASPLYMLAGCPVRSIAERRDRVARFVAWRLPDIADLRVEQALKDGEVAWAALYDQRPEIAVRRDAASPSAWLQGRRVLVLGCGAVGALVAEWCARAGATELTLVDHADIHPGLLVRQPYRDAEIGRPKAEALAEHLRSIRPDATILPVVKDAIRTIFDHAAPPSADLVIDATTSGTVAAKLEWSRWTARTSWPPVVTIVIGHRAQLGVATLAMPGASGGGADILRRLRLAARLDASSWLADFTESLFPGPSRTEMFQPELGYSDVTFVGSASEVAALAGHLFNASLATLAGHAAGRVVAPMSAYLMRLGTDLDDPPSTSIRMGWTNDLTVCDGASGYEVRIAADALAEMRAEARTAAQIGDPTAETGGLLLGEFDDASRVAWVSIATEPPSDSELSPQHFRLGVHGVAERITHYEAMSAGALRFVGTWHTHPFATTARPSTIDNNAMANLLMPVEPAPFRALLVIIAGPPSRWSAWLNGVGTPDVFAQLMHRPTHVPSTEQPP
jgi:integrative and conjugative element protein (TIGR02256 family)